jgi:UDP-N-acetylmuramoylalanine--D-glutamate ligase
VLEHAGKRARAVGNIGVALSDYLLNPNPNEILVVELSSFQLETLQQKKLECAVYLNLTPDHLDRYATLHEYAAAKARIQECLAPDGMLFISKQVQSEYSSLFNPKKTAVFDEPVAQISSLQYTQSGMPEVQNIEASYAVCSRFGISRAVFDEALRLFKKPAHRIEWLGEINGVHYYDDSKGTNIDAVMHAVALLKGPLVLIIGGVDKGASYAPWVDALKGKVRLMVAYGQAAEKMEAELKGHFPLVRVGPFKEAVLRAKREAKRGEAVLLSPGCSSFDQHKNYAHRGEEFKHLVMQ